MERVSRRNCLVAYRKNLTTSLPDELIETVIKYATLAKFTYPSASRTRACTKRLFAHSLTRSLAHNERAISAFRKVGSLRAKSLRARARSSHSFVASLQYYRDRTAAARSPCIVPRRNNVLAARGFAPEAGGAAALASGLVSRAKGRSGRFSSVPERAVSRRAHLARSRDTSRRVNYGTPRPSFSYANETENPNRRDTVRSVIYIRANRSRAVVSVSEKRSDERKDAPVERALDAVPSLFEFDTHYLRL